jgi:hypothetical protein
MNIVNFEFCLFQNSDARGALSKTVDFEKRQKTGGTSSTHKSHNMSAPSREKRKNIYFEPVALHGIIQDGIKRRVIKSRSVSEHISKLVRKDIVARRDALINAGVHITPEMIR